MTVRQKGAITIRDAGFERSEDVSRDALIQILVEHAVHPPHPLVSIEIVHFGEIGSKCPQVGGTVGREIRHAHTGTQREAEKAPVTTVLDQGEAEQRIGRLGLPIRQPPLVVFALIEAGIRPADMSDAVHPAGDGDDARGRRRQDLVHDQVGEEEMAEMVGLELALEPVFGEPEWYGHDAGIIDENVDVGDVVPRVDSDGGLADTGEGHEIHFQCSDLDRGVFGCQITNEILLAGARAAGENKHGRLCHRNLLDKIVAQSSGRDSAHENCFLSNRISIAGDEFTGSRLLVVGDWHCVDV